MQKPYGATLKYFFIIILCLLIKHRNHSWSFVVTRGHSWSLVYTFRQDRLIVSVKCQLLLCLITVKMYDNRNF